MNAADSIHSSISIPDENDRSYPELALDIHTTGFWGWVDRTSQRAGAILNPILVKETRQSLKTRSFIASFFLLLFASLAWSLIGVGLEAPDIYTQVDGKNMLMGFYTIIAIPVLVVVPLTAFRSLASELDDGTFEMLSITRLSSSKIVTGKLASACLQLVVYFSAIAPCFAFCYLLRGVSLPSIATVLLTNIVVSLLLVTFGLLMATLARGSTGQIFNLLIVLAAIGFLGLGCYSFCTGALIAQGERMPDDALGVFIGLAVLALSFIVLFVKAAAARISPVTENRSTRLRHWMFFQQFLFISMMDSFAWHEKDMGYVGAGIVVMGIYWAVMGTLMMGENSQLSHRVMRDLPETHLARMFLTWFNPGSGTGLIFACVNCAVGAIVWAAYHSAWHPTSRNMEFVWMMAILVPGYLMFYLGLGRLLISAIATRTGKSFLLSGATMGVLLMLSLVVPTVFRSYLYPYGYATYSLVDLPNWGYTIMRAPEGQSVPMPLITLVLLAGCAMMTVNLLLMYPALRYRRIAVPDRVLAEMPRRESPPDEPDSPFAD